MSKLTAMTFAAACAATAPALAGPALTYGSDFGGANSNPAVMGYQFSVLEAFNITALGMFDDSLDGLADPHEVAIWDIADQSLIVSATVPGGTTATLIGQWRYVDVALTGLLAGHTYAIAAFFPADTQQPGDENDFVPQICDGCNAPYLVDPRIVLEEVTGRFVFSDDLVFPVFDFIPQLTANFLIEEPVETPEPGALGLALVGLLGLAGLRRRRV